MKNIRSKTFSVGCFLLLIMLFSFGVAAQKTEKMPAREMMNLTVVTVKPEMVPEFEKMIKDEYNPALIKGGRTVSDVWQMAIGNPFEYVFVQPLENFAAMDGPSPLAKALGKEGTEAFFARISKMVTAVNSQVIEARPDLSYTPELTARPNVAVVIHIYVSNGRTDEFENFIVNEYLPVIRKSGIPGMWANKAVFGGNTNKYTLVQLQSNFAELDKGPPMMRVLKPEEVKQLMAKIPKEVVEDVEVYVARYNPGLSIPPPMPTAAKQ